MERLVRLFLFCGMLVSLFPALHAQNIDYLQKAREFLAKGECEKAEYAYQDYKKEHPSGNREVEQRIAQCRENNPSQPQSSTLKSGDIKTIKIGNLSFDMVYVEGGTFTMGCTPEQGSDCKENEKPAHKVTVDGFYIGKFEVTQALWKEVMYETVYQQRDKANKEWLMIGVGNDYPIYYVNWDEANEFCLELSRMTGLKFRLPTEAEWEYAARGGNKSTNAKYSGSSVCGKVAWCADNSEKKTHPVGQKLRNELGIYDMSGNVYEWCSDWFGVYNSSSQSNPKGPTTGSSRVLRGGSCSFESSRSRVSYRGAGEPSYRDYWGFRIVLQK